MPLLFHAIHAFHFSLLRRHFLAIFSHYAFIRCLSAIFAIIAIDADMLIFIIISEIHTLIIAMRRLLR
jgi:hypothetical protein